MEITEHIVLTAKNFAEKVNENKKLVGIIFKVQPYFSVSLTAWAESAELE